MKSRSCNELSPVLRDPINGRVLIFAPIGRDATAIVEVLGRSATSAHICTDLPQLVAGIAEGAAAVFVAEEGLFGKNLTPLLDLVGAQATWSDLPFIVLTSRQELPAVARWRQTLVTNLRNVTLLERPVQAITLTSTILSAVRARRRQYEVRSLIEAREQAAQQLETLIAERTAELADANIELRNQIEQRTQVEETLRQAQKIEAMGQMTGGVAHDFNNLLMVISGGLELLDRQPDPARRQRLMDGMRQAAQRGASLTRQLLAFSRRQPLQPKPVDLYRQIGAMQELLDRSLSGDVTVVTKFASDIWPVEVDPSELELVVLNLAVNARDAMPKGGSIVIEASNLTLTDGHLRGDFVRLAVVDTGTGIAREVIDRVFEPFFTTKDVGKGSGLGLAQVHGFATQSGGRVEIESEAGRGTSIILLLPRSARVPASQGPNIIDSPERAALKKHSGYVLLVEDDAEVASLVSDMLTQLGFAVTRVVSAVAALGALADGRPIDLVFSDVMMPGGMNGVDLAREIRVRRPGLPVLLTSGFAGAAKLAADEGGFRILSKPYGLDELAQAISDIRL